MCSSTVFTLIVMLTPYSVTALTSLKSNSDQLFKDLLRSTKLSAQLPAKTERRENYICENIKPGSSTNLTEFCASSNGTQVLESTLKPTENNQTTNSQVTSPNNILEAPQTSNQKGPNKLEQIYQALYVAQAQVQLEVKQIQRAQSLAAAQQKALEEASMNVRTITGALHAAQQDVATAAMRAQTAQLQLAAHDQLLFAARQKVDALSSQAVGLQAEDSIIIPKLAVDIDALLGKLKAPLADNLRPTAIPAMCPEVEARLALPPTTLNPTNQSTTLSSDPKVRDIEKAIKEIIESRYKRPIKKRSNTEFKIRNHNDLRRSAQYDDYFYRWFVKDIRKERRKRRLKEAKKRSKLNYDYHNVIE